MENKKEIEKRIKEIEKEKNELNKELKWVSLPDNIRETFRTQFGLPRIMQSLSIEKKLDKETYHNLNKELEELCENIIGMIPKSKKEFLKEKNKKDYCITN